MYNSRYLHWLFVCVGTSCGTSYLLDSRLPSSLSITNMTQDGVRVVQCVASFIIFIYSYIIQVIDGAIWHMVAPLGSNVAPQHHLANKVQTIISKANCKGLWSRQSFIVNGSNTGRIALHG